VGKGMRDFYTNKSLVWEMVCAHACVCVCVHACVHVCMCACVRVCVCAPITHYIVGKCDQETGQWEKVWGNFYTKGLEWEKVCMKFIYQGPRVGHGKRFA
jgi:hypothetical protein